MANSKKILAAIMVLFSNFLVAGPRDIGYVVLSEDGHANKKVINVYGDITRNYLPQLAAQFGDFEKTIEIKRKVDAAIKYFLKTEKPAKTITGFAVWKQSRNDSHHHVVGIYFEKGDDIRLYYFDPKKSSIKFTATTND